MQDTPRYPEHVDDSGARPVVTGTDIKVSLVAHEVEHLGMTPNQVVQAHSHLTLAQVHAALAYYYDHQERIHREWQEARTRVATFRALYPSPLSLKP